MQHVAVDMQIPRMERVLLDYIYAWNRNCPRMVCLISLTSGASRLGHFLSDIWCSHGDARRQSGGRYAVFHRGVLHAAVGRDRRCDAHPETRRRIYNDGRRAHGERGLVRERSSLLPRAPGRLLALLRGPGVAPDELRFRPEMPRRRRRHGPSDRRRPGDLQAEAGPAAVRVEEPAQPPWGRLGAGVAPVGRRGQRQAMRPSRL